MSQPGTSEVLLPIPTDLLDGREGPDRILLWAQLPVSEHTRGPWSSDLRQSGRSRIRKQVTSAKRTDTEPILSDFSYAGYNYFQKRVSDAAHPGFDVTEYGAIPDDERSDRNAIVDAIAAAEANRSGIVFFPPGGFLVKTDTDKDGTDAFTSIRICRSNIIPRGSGSRRGGTIIRQVNAMPPADDHLYPSPCMSNSLPRRRSSRSLATITETATRETFRLEVEDSSRLQEGQRIAVYMNSTEAVNEFLVPHSPEHIGRRLRTEGLEIAEEHSIAGIQGNRIRLSEPLHTNVNSQYGWEVEFYSHLEEIGVEESAFMARFLRSSSITRTPLMTGAGACSGSTAVSIAGFGARLSSTPIARKISVPARRCPSIT